MTRRHMAVAPDNPALYRVSTNMGNALVGALMYGEAVKSVELDYDSNIRTCFEHDGVFVAAGRCVTTKSRATWTPRARRSWRVWRGTIQTCGW